MNWQEHLEHEVFGSLYEVYDYKHAAAILNTEFSDELNEISQALLSFRFSVDDIKQPGGNKGPIVRKLEQVLHPLGWDEKELGATMLVDDGRKIELGSHKVDFTKGRVAFDMEWNSKDQTFDRDLYAFRAFFEYDAISVGIILTRGHSIEVFLRGLGKDVYKKYGASTTNMKKLLYRLDNGRNGGCPVLVLGITPKIVE